MKTLSSCQKVLLAVVLVVMAVGVRGGWIRGNLTFVFDDEDSYAHVAEVLMVAGTFGHGLGMDPHELKPTAHRPPLYPVMIAAFAGDGEHVSGKRLAVLNLVISLGVLAFVFLFCQEVAPEQPWLPWLATAMAIFDPLLLERSGHVMTESPAALWAAAFGWLAARTYRRGNGWGWWAVGLVLGSGALVRPTFLAVIPLMAVAVVFAEGWKGRERWGPAVVYAVVFLLGAGMALAPWAARNQRVFGRPLLATTHGGQTLAMSNGPEFYAHVKEEGMDTPWSYTEFNRRIATEDPLFAPMDPDGPGYRSVDPVRELAMDARLSEMGKAWIRSHPQAFVELVVGRWVQFWKPFPGPLEDHQDWRGGVIRWGTGIWYVSLYALIGVGVPMAFRQGWLRPTVGWMLPVVLAFTAVHSVYWVNMRMRTPLSPWLCVLAAAGLLALLRAGLERARRGKVRVTEIAV